MFFSWLSAIKTHSTWASRERETTHAEKVPVKMLMGRSFVDNGRII